MAISAGAELSTNVGAYAALDAAAARLRLVDGAPARAAAEMAPHVEVALKTTAAAGTTPNGQPWRPTAAGEKPMQHAPSHIKVAAAGSKVIVTLKGPDVRHHLGTARGRIKRQVIPGRQPPDSFYAAALDAIKVVLQWP